MNPQIHADLNVKRWKGERNNYIRIHEVMDSSKSAIGDNRHRFAYHTTHFVSEILPLIFGQTIINSDGKEVLVRDIGIDHLLQDFGGKYAPTLQDYIENMDPKPWMNGQVNLGSIPSSCKKLEEGKVKTSYDFSGKKIEEKVEELVVNRIDRVAYGS